MVWDRRASASSLRALAPARKRAQFAILRARGPYVLSPFPPPPLLSSFLCARYHSHPACPSTTFTTSLLQTSDNLNLLQPVNPWLGNEWQIYNEYYQWCMFTRAPPRSNTPENEQHETARPNSTRPPNQKQPRPTTRIPSPTRLRQAWNSTAPLRTTRPQTATM